MTAAIMVVVIAVFFLMRKGVTAQNDKLINLHQETRQELIKEIRLNREAIERTVVRETKQPQRN